MQLVNILHVDARAGSDTIWTSNHAHDGAFEGYIGGAGNDTFHIGTQNATLLYNSTSNPGYDIIASKVVSSELVLKGVVDDAVISLHTGNLGAGNLGYAAVDRVEGTGGGARILGQDTTTAGLLDHIDLSDVQLVNIVSVDARSGNDTIRTSNHEHDGAFQGYMGGAGNDTFHIGAQDVTLLYAGSNPGYDTIASKADGSEVVLRGVESDTIISLHTGAIGAGNLGYAAVSRIVGDAAGVRILGQSTTTPGQLDHIDLSDVQLVNIVSVDARSGNDTIRTSNHAHDGTFEGYSGGDGNDTFHIGTQDVTLLYAGTGTGEDVIAATAGGGVTLRATVDNTYIAINTNAGLGYAPRHRHRRRPPCGRAGARQGRQPVGRDRSLPRGAHRHQPGQCRRRQRHRRHLGGQPTQQTYVGGSGTDTLVVALTAEQAANSALLQHIASQLAPLVPNGPSGNGTVNMAGINFTSSEFENFKLAMIVGDELVEIDASHILIGTNGHDNGAAALDVETHVNGAGGETPDNWMILGLGATDTLRGSEGDDILVGGAGNDTMDGRGGSDTYLVGPDNNLDAGDLFIDTGTGPDDYDRILATADGTQIVINLPGVNPINPNRSGIFGIEEVSANGYTGVNIVGDSSEHNRLDLSGVLLTGIEEVRGGGSTSGDTFWTSSIAGPTVGYYGGKGNDTFHLGGVGTTILYDQNSSGFDFFTDNTVGVEHRIVVRAGAGDTVIGLSLGGTNGPGFGGANSVDVIDGSLASGTVIIRGSDSAHDRFDFSQTQLIGITMIDAGAGNDRIIGSASDDTFIWNVGDGRDRIEGGANTAVGDTYIANGNATDETFRVETVAAYVARAGAYNGGGEIVVSRGGTVIADLSGIEEIVIDGGGGNDQFLVGGDFGPTDLHMSTIRIVGSGGDNVFDLTGRASDHRVVIETAGGADTVVGALRAGDVIRLAAGERIEDYTLRDNGDGTWTLTGNDNSVTFEHASLPQFEDATGIVELPALSIEERVVGYYAMGNVADAGYVAAIERSGATALKLSALDAANLEGLDALIIDGYYNANSVLAQFNEHRGAIMDAVAGGMGLNIDDGYGWFNGYFPGHDVQAVNWYGYGVSVASGSPFMAGIGGLISQTDLDDGNYSIHGAYLLATLPEGAVPHLFAESSADHVAGFSFQHGSGAIVFSTIPLSFYFYNYDNYYNNPADRNGDGVVNKMPNGASNYLANVIENLIGNGQDSGGDLDIVGTSLRNTLTGGAGDDLIAGLGGDDILYGGDGNDRLEGGEGYNVLHGGAGDDVFVIDPSALNEGLSMPDLIADYTHGDDQIDLGALLAALETPPLDADVVKDVVTLADDGAGNTNLVVDTNGAEGGGEVVVATLQGGHSAVTVLFGDLGTPVTIGPDEIV